MLAAKELPKSIVLRIAHSRRKCGWPSRGAARIYSAIVVGRLLAISCASILGKIDVHEGEEVDESAFKALVRQAAALNSSGKSKSSKKAKS